MIVVGHTKRKTLTDITTGEEYEMLTTNMQEKYFNSIKNKLHFLGVASIDRSIEYQKVKQRMGADKEVGKVKGESRVITFRDDNFNIDSKSRFAEIAPSIPLDSDAFIKAMEDAIKVEMAKEKHGKTIEEVKVEQEVEREEKINKAIEEVKEKEENKVDVDENKKLIQQILEKLNDTDAVTKGIVITFAKDNGISLGAPETTPTKEYKAVLEQFNK